MPVLLIRTGGSGRTRYCWNGPEPVLATFRKTLTQQYQRTNANAAANPHLEIRANSTFHIATHSPMSWAHTGMPGEYDFSEEKRSDPPGILP